MLPVRFESRTVSPSRTSVTNWPRMTSGSGSSAVPTPERLHADLHRLHLTVVVRAPDVDEVLPAAVELVEVVGEVVQR